MTAESGELLFGFIVVTILLIGAVLVLRPVYMPVWHLFRGTQQFLVDWFGEPARVANGREIVKERPGAMQRLAQLETNSGSTMKDKIDEMVAKIDGIQQSATDARDLAATAVDRAKNMQHDVTNIRAGQEGLLEMHDRLAHRIEAIEAHHEERSIALGDALIEQVDVALKAEEAR